MKKLYLSSTTLLFHLCEAPDPGKVVENLVINSSKVQFFWRRGTSEVDCVLIEDGTIIPLESKYRNNIQKKELKGLIIFLPLWKWLLQWKEIGIEK